MAENIALGMRLSTSSELMLANGIEGEISVVEGEWRAVVHDGVTKGGYPVAKKSEVDEVRQLAESSIKSVNGNTPDSNGNIEVFIPAGVHVGANAPIDDESKVWIDTDGTPTQFVRTVNNIAPDSNGNIDIGVDTSELATKVEVSTAIANLVNSAPTTLDTLGELATALQNNVGITNALNSAIGTKANSSEVVKLSGNQTISGTKTFSSTIAGSISGNAATATKATQDASGNVITSTYMTKSSITSGTADLTAGSSSLATGSIYLMYE